MTPIRSAFAYFKACESVGEDEFALLASIPASCFFDRRALHDKNLKADIGGFRTDIGRSQNSHFLFLNIARRTHTTESVLFKLSPASCMFGRIDTK